MENSKNYLDFIPIPAKNLKYDITDNQVTIYIENKGFFNFIAQKIWHKPRISQIHLDEMGNFIWPLMDGNRDIDMIAKAVKEHFGDKAEPLYNRIVQYFKTLKSYEFIEFINK